MTLGQRIFERLNELEKSQVWLCAEVEGLEIGTLNALVRRGSRNSIFAPAIAEKLGVSLDWLITGQGRKDFLKNDSLPTHTQKSIKASASSWPFKRFTAAQFNALDEEDKAYIDKWVAARIAEPARPTFAKKISA
jgi:hypothetical protein